MTRAHSQHRMFAVRDPAVANFALKRPQRGRHRLEALAKFNKTLADRPLAEAGAQQAGLEMRKAPAIKRNLTNVILRELLSQIGGDVFVIDRPPWCGQQVTLSP